ncbi:TIR domain-containing protein [Pyxidicoccus trucidator]|uniref:WD40 domain-containing protein n=1 Tax=Pyxidicoccus trucidator TaxID=2709662 RepID=UPI0013DBEF52|nr:TIR domain-containing protein [Pyxidicoccus trucidator]
MVELTDVYLCCVPEEREFVRSLEDTLRLARRKPFVADGEGATGSWEPGAEAALKAARNFVLILSPDSAASPRCRAQVAHAVKQKKRIVPVLRRDVQAEARPRAVTLLRPIDFREQDDAKAAMRALLLALDSALTVDVFICYSRKDKPFVDHLYAAFERAEKRTWLDLRNIPLLAEWPTEIEAGIEAAEHFLFVLSPDSVASTECRRELDHALRLHKRLVPVLYRDVPDAQVPRPLSVIERVPLREKSFDDDFVALLAALGTDLSFVRAHTRLLVRALDWEKQQQDDSLLLQGKDLEAAEAWLGTAVPGTGPQPVPLHTEYILRSRQEATRRLRLQLAAVSMGLVIAIALMLTALYQYSQKEEQRRIAVSLQLAAQSNEQRPRKLELALLLAAESFEASPTVEARSALLSALRDASYLQSYLHGHERRISQVAFSPDGRWLASGSHDGTARRWDVRTWESHAIPELASESDFVQGVAFSGDGRFLAAAADDGAVRVWDSVSGTPVCAPLKKDGGPMQSVAFSPKGGLLVAGDLLGKLHLWQVEPGRCEPLETAVHGAEGPVVQLAFSPDGQRLASGHGDGSVLMWQVQAEQLREPHFSPLGAAKRVLDLAFSPDGQWVAVGGFDGSLRLWSITTPEAPVIPLLNGGERVFSVAFSPDGRRLASGGADGRVRLWDPQLGRELPGFNPGRQSWVTSLAFSRDGRYLISGSADGALARWDLEMYEDPGEHRPLGRRLTGKRGQVMHLAFSPDAGTLVSGGLDGDVVPWALGSPSVQPLAARPCSRFEEVRGVGFHPGGGEFAVAAGDTAVRLDARSCASIGTPFHVDAGPETLMGIAYGEDGNTLVAVSDVGAVYLWDVTGKPDARLAPDAGVGVVDVDFSPDRQRVALGAGDGSVLFVEAKAGGRYSRAGPIPRSSVSAVAFSPDGRLLASGGDDGRVLFLDASTGKALGDPVPTQAKRVFSVAFSGDGRTAASGYEDGTLVLWDVQSREPIGIPLKGHRDFVTALAFTADGAFLASGDEKGTVLLWDARVESWQARACRIANRDFTPDERRRHFGDPPVPGACQRLLGESP